MIPTLETVKNCAHAVYNELGAGHSEAVYESAMVVEMGLRDIEGPIMRQVACPVTYKGFNVGMGYIDILVSYFLLIELKTVAKLTKRDETQVRKYLASTGLGAGLLINFNSENVEIVEVHSVDCYINDDPSFVNHLCINVPGGGKLMIPEELAAYDPDDPEDHEFENEFIKSLTEIMSRRGNPDPNLFLKTFIKTKVTRHPDYDDCSCPDTLTHRDEVKKNDEATSTEG